MAADQVLLNQYQPVFPPTLRIYFWDRPTLSLGRNEKLDSDVDLEACQRLGIPIVRRLTGGKAVLHGFDLTYSIVGSVLDEQFSGGVLDNYRFIARGFFQFFEALGLSPKYQQGQVDSENADPHICFADASAYEILIDGKKIIGNAQRIKNNRNADGSSHRVFLQHGSIPMTNSNELLCQIFPNHDSAQIKEQILSLESLGIFPKQEVMELQSLLQHSLKMVFEAEFQSSSWSAEEQAEISRTQDDFLVSGI